MALLLISNGADINCKGSVSIYIYIHHKSSTNCI